MKSCSETCREEFRLKSFLLKHDNPQTFVQFQCGYQTFYLIWRIVWVIYHVVWIIMTGVRAEDWAGPDPAQQIKWFIYLTDLAYMVLTLAALVDFIAVTVVFAKRPDIRKGSATEIPWYLQMSWVMFNMANTISVTMSLLYWSLVHSDSKPVDAINIGTHILNSVYVILNLSVTGMPVRVLHFWYPVLFAVAYSLFTLFYYLGGGTNHNGSPYIYRVIDWREPGTAVGYVLAVILVAVPIVHAVMYGIHTLKVFIASKCCGTSESFEPMDGGTEMQNQKY